MKHLKKYEYFSGQKKIYRIRDLAEFLSYEFGDDAPNVYEIFLKELSSAFRRNGNEGVVELFKIGSKLTIKPISRGKFVFE